jgi:Tfp pilus assembly protein PilP
VAPPPVIINLKFFGTKTDARARRIQGFFADGDEVYLVSEGDLVANRYRVIRIGDNSAEVEELSSKTRRQISLLTQ